MLSYHDNTKDYIKMLSRKHGALAQVGAASVNEGAEKIQKEYHQELKKFTLRNRYTAGAVKLYRANAQRKSGEFRKLTGINAKVGVLKMKGGKEHYLKLQEEGGTKSGHSTTAGKVPIPIDKTARTAGAHAGIIKGALQLQKAGAVQTLNLAGKEFGTHNDGYGMRQRWAILHKYTGTSRTGRVVNRYGWNLNKQFFFVGMRRGFGIFKVEGKNRIHMIRTLEKNNVRIKPTHGFKKSVLSLRPGDMDRAFMNNAKRYLGK